jgi:hypothetical protein
LGNPIAEFSHDFADLPPAQSLTWSDTWPSAGAAGGRYYFTAGVIFDGAAAGPVIRWASADRFGYLPLSLKGR